MNVYGFDDVGIGLAAEFSATVTDEMMQLFLKVSGDLNPLHVDAEYALKKGFTSRVVYGLLTSSLYSTLVGVYLPGKYCLLQGIDISFQHPVYIEDVLNVRGEVSYINEAYKMIEIKASIRNNAGKKVSRAKIKVGFL